MLNKDNNLFQDYPDIVTVADMRVMLGGKDKLLGRTTAYKLLKDKKLKNVRKIGREYKIPKKSIIDYLLDE